MTLELKPATKEARLPSTACEEEFFAEVKAFAKANGVSMALVIRTSLRFFLDANVGKTDNQFGKKKRGKKGRKGQVSA
jgi:hypothetical protein